MRVRVRLLGSLRQPGTAKEANYDVLQSAAVSSLIKIIISEYPKLEGVLDGVGNLVMLNGVEIGNLEGLATILNEGAEVVFVPVTHGGR
jgi:molybdopterin converting factor small subunit